MPFLFYYFNLEVYKMGASSVTGVGYGSALGKNKGSDNVSIGVGKLIGPHVVAAGVVQLAETAGTASKYNLGLPSGAYAVSLFNLKSGDATAVTGFVDCTTAATSGSTVLGIAGPVSGVFVSYTLCTTGMA